jgi:hypothetical protein
VPADNGMWLLLLLQAQHLESELQHSSCLLLSLPTPAAPPVAVLGRPSMELVDEGILLAEELHLDILAEAVAAEPHIRNSDNSNHSTVEHSWHRSAELVQAGVVVVGEELELHALREEDTVQSVVVSLPPPPLADEKSILLVFSFLLSVY